MSSVTPMRKRIVRLSVVAALFAATIAALVACWRAITRPAPPPVRNDQLTWYLHRATPLLSFRKRSTFVTFSTAQPLPPRAQLIAALDHPESFAAAHMLLLNGPSPTTQPGSFNADSAHRDMALRLESAGRVKLEDRPDGSCLATIDSLRVILKPAERKGSYFGQGRVDHTIYAATAEIDSSQQATIRDQWLRRPTP